MSSVICYGYDTTKIIKKKMLICTCIICMYFEMYKVLVHTLLILDTISEVLKTPMYFYIRY